MSVSLLRSPQQLTRAWLGYGYKQFPCTCTGDMLVECEGCKEWCAAALPEREEC